MELVGTKSEKISYSVMMGKPLRKIILIELSVDRNIILKRK